MILPVTLPLVLVPLAMLPNVLNISSAPPNVLVVLRVILVLLSVVINGRMPQLFRTAFRTLMVPRPSTSGDDVLFPRTVVKNVVPMQVVRLMLVGTWPLSRPTKNVLLFVGGAPNTLINLVIRPLPSGSGIAFSLVCLLIRP